MGVSTSPIHELLCQMLFPIYSYRSRDNVVGIVTRLLTSAQGNCSLTPPQGVCFPKRPRRVLGRTQPPVQWASWAVLGGKTSRAPGSLLISICHPRFLVYRDHFTLNVYHTSYIQSLCSLNILAVKMWHLSYILTRWKVAKQNRTNPLCWLVAVITGALRAMTLMLTKFFASYKLSDKMLVDNVEHADLY